MKIIETIQRAENGGSPLRNSTAAEENLGHGTPLLIIPTRQFVAFLMRVRGKKNAREVSRLLREHNSFVFSVKESEGA